MPFPAPQQFHPAGSMGSAVFDDYHIRPEQRRIAGGNIQRIVTVTGHRIYPGAYPLAYFHRILFKCQRINPVPPVCRTVVYLTARRKTKGTNKYPSRYPQNNRFFHILKISL